MTAPPTSRANRAAGAKSAEPFEPKLRSTIGLTMNSHPGRAHPGWAGTSRRTDSVRSAASGLAQAVPQGGHARVVDANADSRPRACFDSGDGRAGSERLGL